MSTFDDTLSFIAALDESPTPEGICRELIGLSGRFGLTNLIAGTMPGSGTPPTMQSRHLLLEGWPSGWVEQYVRRNYIHIDPVIQRIKTDTRSFSWDEVSADPRHEKCVATMMGEAHEFGLAGGFAVPLVTLEGVIASVSFGGRHVEIPPEARGMLSLVSTYALGRAMQLHSQPRRALPLSPREREAMRWAAAGKTDWEISVILAISEHTAAKHIDNAKRKLGASNRAHAVAEAIRAGIIC